MSELLDILASVFVFWGALIGLLIATLIMWLISNYLWDEF